MSRHLEAQGRIIQDHTSTLAAMQTTLQDHSRSISTLQDTINFQASFAGDVGEDLARLHKEFSEHQETFQSYDKATGIVVKGLEQRITRRRREIDDQAGLVGGQEGFLGRPANHLVD
jgi:hypothetical protein